MRPDQNIVISPDAEYLNGRMLNAKEEIIDTIIPIIEHDTEIELCLMYGSTVQDRLTERSDIDIAIGSEHGISNQKCLEVSRILTLATDREVSVIAIEKMEGVILQEVLVKGITIKNTNVNFKANLIIRMLEFTEDILPFQLMGINKKVMEYLHE